MKCPECTAWATVKDSRQTLKGTYRRYECANLHRFTTSEIHVPSKKGQHEQN